MARQVVVIVSGLGCTINKCFGTRFGVVKVMFLVLTMKLKFLGIRCFMLSTFLVTFLSFLPFFKAKATVVP